LKAFSWIGGEEFGAEMLQYMDFSVDFRQNWMFGTQSNKSKGGWIISNRLLMICIGSKFLTDESC